MSPPDENTALSAADTDAPTAGNAQPPPASAAPQAAPAPEEAQPVQGGQPPQAPAAPTAPTAPAVTGTDGTDVAQLAQRLEQAFSGLERTESAIRLLQAHVDALVKDLAALNSRLGSIPEHLQGSMGYRIREAFKCDSCGAQGTVAGRVTCTNCNRESLWGWWPET